MTTINSSAASNLQAALTLLKSSKLEIGPSGGVSAASARSNLSEPKDHVALSEIARLANADGSAKESPTRAIILNAEGRQIGRLFDGGASVINVEAVLRELGEPVPSAEEIDARKMEFLKSGRGSEGFLSLMRHVYGDTVGDLYRDMEAAKSSGNPLDGVVQIIRKAKIGHLKFTIDDSN